MLDYDKDDRPQVLVICLPSVIYKPLCAQ